MGSYIQHSWRRGEENEALIDRARSTGNQQGQWLDDGAAAELLKGLHVEGAGPRSVRIPGGLEQVIMPDGSIVQARAATIVPSRNGLYKAGFPIIGPNYEGLDLLFIGGFRAVSVLEIVDGEGKAAVLQIAFMDGSSLVCTVWTDWSLLVERRPDVEIPDYLWPAEDYSRRPIVQNIPEDGVEVMSLVTSADEFGVQIGVDIEFDGHRVSARSVGGEILLSVH